MASAAETLTSTQEHNLRAMLRECGTNAPFPLPRKTGDALVRKGLAEFVDTRRARSAGGRMIDYHSYRATAAGREAINAL